MFFISPDLKSVLIVLGFLGTLLVVRYIIIAKAHSIKSTLGVQGQRIQLLEVYRIDRTLELALLDIQGNRVVVLHGGGHQAALLKLDAIVTEKCVPDA